MPRLWDILSEPSRAVLKRVAGRRWRDPDQKAKMDDIPVDISQEMKRQPLGNASLLGGGHGE
jgi:hypothetical protein